nr:c-type cytochrome [uncultured Roseateles sp.]
MRHCLLIALLLLTACSRDDKPTPAQAESLRPADTRLAAVYERSCLNCHGRSDGTAPLTGHASAWAPRLAKGMPALLHSVHQGLNSMPAMGLCPDCSDSDLEHLITFMSRTDKQ